MRLPSAMAYKRSTPPLAVRLAMGVMMDYVMRPMVKIQERRGGAVRMRWLKRRRGAARPSRCA